jgi:hypothetical protein
MRRHLSLAALLLIPTALFLSGCGSPPTEEKGTFKGEKTFVIRRGSIDVIVQTGGEASFVQRQWPYGHPMGPPGDTECIVTTPAGRFRIENRELRETGVRINGTLYELQNPPDGGRMKLLIDKEGKIKAASTKDEDGNG